jgi:hypothetical protein
VYTRARGREPLPGFEKWFLFAQKHNAIVVEELFDQVYRDLEPFWGVPANHMRRFAGNFEDRLSTRNGTVSMTTSHTEGPGRKQIERWASLMKEVESFLPNLDMAVNTMDGSRVFAPWEDVAYTVRTKRNGSENTTVHHKLLEIPLDLE